MDADGLKNDGRDGDELAAYVTAEELKRTGVAVLPRFGTPAFAARLQSAIWLFRDEHEAEGSGYQNGFRAERPRTG